MEKAGLGLFFVVAAMVVFGSINRLQTQPSGDLESFVRGNQLYENGRFVEAAQTYQALVDKGVDEAALFYNLGNAYFKAGEIGYAILNYERAMRLAPRDPDIQANLALAQTQLVDRYETTGASLVSRWVTLARSWLTINEMAIAVLSLWLLLGGLFVWFRTVNGRRPEWVQYGLIAILVLFLGGLFSLGSRLYLENSRPQAIVVESVVEVLSGPGEQYVTEFTLHSGAKVGIVETRGAWTRLALPGDQLQGWVPAEMVVLVQQPDTTS